MKNETQPQHTLGEWKVSGNKTRIKSGDNLIIADCRAFDNIKEEEAKANAQRIVKAVNILSILEEEIEHANKFKEENLSLEGRYKKLYLTNLLKQADLK